MGQTLLDPTSWLFFSVGTLISILPLLIYIAYFDKEDQAERLGVYGVIIIKILRKFKKNG